MIGVGHWARDAKMKFWTEFTELDRIALRENDRSDLRWRPLILEVQWKGAVLGYSFINFVKFCEFCPKMLGSPALLTG
jgi:hypothetical protein